MLEDYTDQDLREPVVISQLQNNQSVSTIQEAFLLSEADFIRIKANNSKTSAAAGLIFSGIVGYAIGLGPKLAPLLNDQPSTIEFPEIVTIVVGTIASLVIYFIGQCLPNEKKEVIKKINTHFEDSDNRFAVTRDRS